MEPSFRSRGKNDLLTTEKLWVQNLLPSQFSFVKTSSPNFGSLAFSYSFEMERKLVQVVMPLVQNKLS